MKDFWDNQSLKYSEFIHSISNLSYEKDFSIQKSHKEKDKLEKLFNSINKKFKSSLEIGAGTCQWTNLVAKNSKLVLATDTSKGMLNKGRNYMETNFDFKHISYFIGDIVNELNPINAPYDLFFISGLLLYLNDKQLIDLLTFISNNSVSDSYIILREPIGIKKEFIIKNKFSSELKTIYSAKYRTEETFKDFFNSKSFKILSNEWFHPQGSKFNKWKETRLKLMLFRRI